MGMKQRGLLVVFSGPSGVGKDSVLKKVLASRDDLKLSVSYTTRKPRDGEVHGKDYYFVSKEEFFDVVNSGQMLEYAEYCGNYYGTPLSTINKELDAGNTVILEIEVQGGEQILSKFPDAVSMFLVPPSLEELTNRLKNRNLDSQEIILKRISEAKREIEFSCNYKYVIINDSIDECAGKILKIIDSEFCLFRRMQEYIKEVLNNG